MNRSLPISSIIIPVYNREEFIERALRSVINQKTNYNFEIICIDDASSDSSNIILNKYLRYIKLIRNDTNKGLPASLNIGINHSFGKYVVRVDSDDYVSENFVELLTLCLEQNNELDAVSSDYYFIDEKSNRISERIVDCSIDPIACGIMFRKDLLFNIGLYDEEFLYLEDRELRLRFEFNHKITRLPIPLYRYRKHASNMTNDLKIISKFEDKLKNKYEQ